MCENSILPNMCETTPPVPTAHLETLSRDKSIACDELFKKCLGDSNACENYIDFQQLQLQSQQNLFNKVDARVRSR